MGVGCLPRFDQAFVGTSCPAPAEETAASLQEKGAVGNTPGEEVQRRDGDRHSDIVWRNTTTGANTVWLSANIASPLRLTAVIHQTWKMVP